MGSVMIPKIIHCFWFSGEKKPTLMSQCIKSWRKYASDFDIREWNVDMLRSEFGKLPSFAEDAIAAKKWAFASDWARFAVIERFGGVYLDLDVELIRSIDDLIADGHGFFALETDNPVLVDPGYGFAAPSGDSAVKALVKRYEKLTFDPACHLSQNCSTVSTDVLMPLIETGKLNQRLLPPTFFNPKGCATGKPCITIETRGIHHFNMGWTNWKQRLAYKILPRLGINVHPLVMMLRKVFCHNAVKHPNFAQDITESVEDKVDEFRGKL